MLMKGCVLRHAYTFNKEAVLKNKVSIGAIIKYAANAVPLHVLI